MVLCKKRSQNPKNRCASRAETLVFLRISNDFLQKEVPKPQESALFARRNVDFPKDSKHFGEKGMPETQKLRRAWRAETLISPRFSNDFGKKWLSKKPQKPARFARASRSPRWPGQPSNRGLYTQKELFFRQSNRPIPEKESFGKT